MATVPLALLEICTQNFMFIRYSRFLSHINASCNISKLAGYISLPDSTPQRHAATIPGIKLLQYELFHFSANTVIVCRVRIP
jgi:hypothetical protein